LALTKSVAQGYIDVGLRVFATTEAAGLFALFVKFGTTFCHETLFPTRSFCGIIAKFGAKRYIAEVVDSASVGLIAALGAAGLLAILVIIIALFIIEAHLSARALFGRAAHVFHGLAAKGDNIL
jgi:hypothetical protein